MDPNLIKSNMNNILNMVLTWKQVSEDLLIRQINELTDLGGHGEFVTSIYPMIQDTPTKDKINSALLKIASNNSMTYEFRARAIYMSSELNLPETGHMVLKIIDDIGDIETIKDKMDIFAFLNSAIQKLSLREATDFLSRQLDIYLKYPDSNSCLGSSIWLLEDVNSDKAAYYWNRMGISSMLYRHISEWTVLSVEELKEQVKRVIGGHGMGGMGAPTQYLVFITKFYPKIKNKELSEKVNKILMELIDDTKDGYYCARAIYICSNIPLAGIKEKLLKIIGIADNFFRSMEQAVGIEDNDFNMAIGCISELNRAIGHLNIIEAKDFLIKQLPPLKNNPPQPLTKEHVFYYICARSALDVLRKLAPDSVKEYTHLLIK